VPNEKGKENGYDGEKLYALIKEGKKIYEILEILDISPDILSEYLFRLQKEKRESLKITKFKPSDKPFTIIQEHEKFLKAGEDAHAIIEKIKSNMNN